VKTVEHWERRLHIARFYVQEALDSLNESDRQYFKYEIAARFIRELPQDAQIGLFQMLVERFGPSMALDLIKEQW